MKQNKKTIKIILLILSLVMLTGCTKTLTGEDKKPVKYEETGKALTENVLCRPTDENVIEIYKENKVDVDKLPKCESFKPFAEYEGLWTTIFVKPLACNNKYRTIVRKNRTRKRPCKRFCYNFILFSNKINFVSINKKDSNAVWKIKRSSTPIRKTREEI